MTSFAGIRAILFDFDGTLRFGSPRSVDLFHRHVRREGFEITPDRRRAAWRWLHAYWADSAELKEDLAAANGDRDSVFWWRHATRHLEALGVAEERRDSLARKLVQRLREEGSVEDIVPEDVPPTLDMLRRSGYRLGLVSNRHHPLDETVERLGIGERFDLVLAAGEVDMWKPDPGLLLHAAALIGSEPRRTLYVGDNPYADVVAARAAGMHAVLVDPEDFFPEAECLRIAAIGELSEVLPRLG
jgi:HAD superfamily hydrolase (TIGR01549 family)